MNFIAENIQRTRSPCFTARRHAIQRGAAHHHCVRAQAQRFHHVAATTESAVGEHGGARTHAIDDLRQRFHRRNNTVEVTPAVVRHINAVGAMINGLGGVVGIQHAFDDQFVRPDFAQRVEVIPLDGIGAQAGAPHRPRRHLGFGALRVVLIHRHAGSGKILEQYAKQPARMHHHVRQRHR